MALSAPTMSTGTPQSAMHWSVMSVHTPKPTHMVLTLAVPAVSKIWPAVVHV